MSKMEHEELVTRVKAMDCEEQLLVARTLPKEIISMVAKENAIATAKNWRVE